MKHPNLSLSVNQLSVHFETGGRLTKAVDNISFEVFKGEVLGIVGESGSGKSLTALSINQLVRTLPNVRQKGDVLFFQNNEELNLSKASPAFLQKIRGRSISMIFQEPMTSLNPVFKCGYQVEEALKWHQKARKKALKEQVLTLFEQVRLKDAQRIYHAYPNELSGGQKQRVMIAMAMACRPEVLIADEPTTALDVTTQRSILELIKQLQEQTGLSVLFISHDLNLVSEMADRVMVLRSGKIVEQGKIKEIFTQPQHAYTMGLMACRPPVDFYLDRLPLVSDFEGKSPEEYGKVIHSLKRPSKVSKQTGEEDPPLLRICDLKVWFPKRAGWLEPRKEFVKAVDGISFDLHKGEILGLVGESGSGKTTVGRAIVRLTEPTDGEVYFQQNLITGMGRTRLRKVRRKIQLIFQDPYASLNPRMSIGNAIMEPLQVHGFINSRDEGKQEVYQLMEQVGLESSYFDRFPNEFSGGQRQRIGIARALAARPDILICDECVASLDVSIQAQILNLLKELNEALNLSMIFISHDLSVIKFLCDRVIIMKAGQMVEQGGVDEIYGKPTSPYTKDLISAIPKGSIKNFF